MAKRRMFSLDIVDTDAFLEMPPTSQNLYFHLGMRADDDGFVANPNKIMKSIGSCVDDLRVLTAKRFVIGFENGIIVIKHWKINNYIPNDRYRATCYIDEKKRLQLKENGSYTECIQDVSNLDTQDRLGKDRLGKDRLLGVAVYFHGDYFDVSETQHEKYSAAYPGLDFIGEYNRMSVWLDNNPRKRKSDYPRFINNWLSRQYKERAAKNEPKKSMYRDLDAEAAE